MNESKTEHVQQLITGYIDNELTQQESQRVRIHCETCAPCGAELADLLKLQQRVQSAKLDTQKAEHWYENIPDEPTQKVRSLGWTMIVAGLVVATAAGAYLIVQRIAQLSIVEVLIVGGIYGGLLMLLVSVIRQRVIEAKTDKYKDVEI